jgi:hypothetical protein
MMDSQQLQGLTRKLLATLKADSMSVQLVNGSEATRGYEVGGASQAQYLKATENKKFVMLWLSPLARAGYRQQDKNSWQAAQFNALEVETVEKSLADYIQKTAFIGNTEEMDTVRELLFRYMDNPDVLRLQQIILQAQEQNYHIKRLLDISSKQAFLLMHNSKGKLVAVANLLPRGRSIKLIDTQFSIEPQIINFIDQRNAWLQAEIN